MGPTQRKIKFAGVSPMLCMGPTGFEPATPWLRAKCSSQTELRARMVCRALFSLKRFAEDHPKFVNR